MWPVFLINALLVTYCCAFNIYINDGIAIPVKDVTNFHEKIEFRKKIDLMPNLREEFKVKSNKRDVDGNLNLYMTTIL